MNTFLARSWLARVLLFVFAVVIAAFFVTPLLWLITAPFNTQANLAVTIPTNPSLANFEAVYNNKFAMRALFQNNLIIGGGVMVLVAGVATMASYGLSRTHVPGRDVLVYVLILFSSVVSGTAAMVRSKLSVMPTMSTANLLIPCSFPLTARPLWARSVMIAEKAIVEEFSRETYTTMVRVDAEQCNGCGACVAACPPRVIGVIPAALYGNARESGGEAQRLPDRAAGFDRAV